MKTLDENWISTKRYATDLFVSSFCLRAHMFAPTSPLAIYSLSQRKWSEDDKLRHSVACKAKDRLTLEQKIEIIELRDLSQVCLTDKFQVNALFLVHLEGTMSLLRFHRLLMS